MPQWGTKDHNRIARTLKTVKPVWNAETTSLAIQEAFERQWAETVAEFVDTFLEDSPFFNRAKFLTSCGVEVKNIDTMARVTDAELDKVVTLINSNLSSDYQIELRGAYGSTGVSTNSKDLSGLMTKSEVMNWLRGFQNGMIAAMHTQEADTAEAQRSMGSI